MAGGVFCIENWSGDLRSPATVLPVLDFLRTHDAARVIHQRVSTPQELAHYMKWFAGNKTYRVAYLGLHGQRGKVFVGSVPVDLRTLVEWSSDDPRTRHLRTPNPSGESEEEWVLDLTGKVLYLGSCASLSVSPKRLKELREETGATAICGYRRSVDWYEAAGFDIMLLSALADATDGAPHSVAAAVKRIRKRAGGLVDSTLGFVCEPDWRP